MFCSKDDACLKNVSYMIGLTWCTQPETKIYVLLQRRPILNQGTAI